MRRIIALCSSLVLVAFFCLAIANTPSYAATAGPATRVIAGSDRYETAILLSKAGFPAGAPSVVLARGDDYADALCGAPLAHAYGGPLLLTSPGGLTSTLIAELQRLHPSRVFLLGLGSTVRTQVIDIVGAEAVTALVGRDRYETAAMVADQILAESGAPTKVVVAPGNNFPDALSVAPLAAANDWPILYTPQWGDVPQVTTEEILKLGVDSALVVGTWAHVALPEVVRKVGSDRYDTCALIAQYALTQGLTSTHIGFVTGENFPDGIASGPYLALDGGILLLAKGTAIPAPVASFLAPLATEIRLVEAIGLSKVPAGPWAFDLQAAIDAARPGAVITLAPGTYPGPFRIEFKTDLTIRGPSSAIVTAKGADTIAIHQSAGIVLDGFTIVGDYSMAGQKCVVVGGGLTGGAFRNLTIQDAGNTGLYARGVFTGVTISDCTITHCGDFGIALQEGYDGVTIANVTASDFAGKLSPAHAVYLKDGQNFTIQDCDLGGAYGPGGGVSAIQIGYGASNGQVLRNTVHDSPFGIVLWGYTGSPTTGITCSGNIGQNNSEVDFYEYGNAVQGTWTADNVGTFKKVIN